MSRTWISRVALLVNLLAMGATPQSLLAQVVSGRVAPQVAPAIALTSPPAGAVMVQNLNPDILLQASALSADYPIAHVVIYVCEITAGPCAGSYELAADIAAPPYEYRWTPRPYPSQTTVTRTYEAWATATNSIGQGNSSNFVTFTVVQPSLPPSINLVVPKLESGYVTPASPVLYATAVAGDTLPPSTIARVEFLDGASVIGSVATPNSVPEGYAFVWQNAPHGIHLVSARVIDSLGYSTTSKQVTIYIVDNDPPPEVALTSPVTGQIFAPPNNVPLAATAMSPTGTIQRVEFVTSDRVIGTAYSPPYALSWVDPPPGTFAVVARAYDDIGVAAASSAAYIQVLPVARPPAVVITAPAAGATLAAGRPLAMAATATTSDGNIGRVDFFAGTTLVGSATSLPYQFTWANATAGVQTLTAKAYDLQSNVGISAPVSVMVSAHPAPTVSLIAPSNNATFSAPAAIVISATAEATAASVTKVDFYANTTLIGTATSLPFSFTWNNVASGAYTLTAKATDSLGAVATSGPIVVSVNLNQMPQVVLTSPPNGQSFYVGQPVTLAATATDPDGTIAKVEFLVDQVVVGSVITPPFTLAWNSVEVGSHAIAARATDRANAVTTSASVTVSVAANSAPTASLVLPRDGQTFAMGAPITLVATATGSDRAIARVEFYADSELVGSATSSPYRVSWLAASVGTHNLAVKAIDDRGSVTTSASALIHVIVPILTITNPADGALVSEDFVLVSGTYLGPPNSGVTVNGVVAQTDGQGKFFVNNLALAPGANTIAVILTAPTGQTLTQSRRVTRDGMAPIQVYAEQSGDFAPTTFTIRIANRTSNAIYSTNYANLEGGDLDATVVNATTIGKITYATPGVFKPTFVITDSAGNAYTQTVMLLARDRHATDQLLKTIWSDFIVSLSSDGKRSANSFLGITARAKYGPVFDALAPRLPDIVSTFAVASTGRLSAEVGEYSIARSIGGIRRLFLVYFVKDNHGIWRLESM